MHHMQNVIDWPWISHTDFALPLLPNGKRRGTPPDFRLGLHIYEAVF
jgi:hypothetical protein